MDVLAWKMGRPPFFVFVLFFCFCHSITNSLSGKEKPDSQPKEKKLRQMHDNY